MVDDWWKKNHEWWMEDGFVGSRETVVLVKHDGLDSVVVKQLVGNRRHVYASKVGAESFFSLGTIR